MDASEKIYDFSPGEAPLLVSVPHAGLEIPDAIEARLSEQARARPDTDWHVNRLYDFLDGIGAGVIVARHSRYVVDLNRPPNDEALYSGQATTGLAPTTTFAGDPLYADGAEPAPEEVAERVAAFWRPYHDKLAEVLADLRARHGFALLWDAHSIRSEVPRLFNGKLPDLNLGTNGGASCAPDLGRRIATIAGNQARYSHVVNGRFKGGYITRHYGRPAEGVHAIQLELSQATYMNEDPPFAFREDLAAAIRPLLRQLLTSVATWTPADAR